ncbi:MAG: S-adenosylmethionine:tRNA ribosyltransferase-isomerase, partial [Saprospiraceae bacterium]
MRTKLSNFNFTLPQELVAQHPSPERDQSRLMVIHKDTGKIEHRIFKDLLEYYDDGDVMI